MPLKFKLRVVLAIHNMTQKDLSTVTGIRQPTISAICNGTIKELPVSVLERICENLNCHVNDIIEYEQE